MDEEKRKKLEASGYHVGSADMFLEIANTATKEMVKKERRTRLTITVNSSGTKPGDRYFQEDYITQAVGESDESFMKRARVVLEVLRHRAGG